MWNVAVVLALQWVFLVPEYAGTLAKYVLKSTSLTECIPCALDYWGVGAR